MVEQKQISYTKNEMHGNQNLPVSSHKKFYVYFIYFVKRNEFRFSLRSICIERIIQNP